MSYVFAMHGLQAQTSIVYINRAKHMTYSSAQKTDSVDRQNASHF